MPQEPHQIQQKSTCHRVEKCSYQNPIEFQKLNSAPLKILAQQLNFVKKKDENLEESYLELSTLPLRPVVLREKHI